LAGVQTLVWQDSSFNLARPLILWHCQTKIDAKVSFSSAEKLWRRLDSCLLGVWTDLRARPLVSLDCKTQVWTDLFKGVAFPAFGRIIESCQTQVQANHYFYLENPQDIAQFLNPQLTLERCQGLIISDEI